MNRILDCLHQQLQAKGVLAGGGDETTFNRLRQPGCVLTAFLSLSAFVLNYHVCVSAIRFVPPYICTQRAVAVVIVEEQVKKKI